MLHPTTVDPCQRLVDGTWASATIDSPATSHTGQIGVRVECEGKGYCIGVTRMLRLACQKVSQRRWCRRHVIRKNGKVLYYHTVLYFSHPVHASYSDTPTRSGDLTVSGCMIKMTIIDDDKRTVTVYEALSKLLTVRSVTCMLHRIWTSRYN